MARPKSVSLNLPRDVHCVTKPNGRRYYYYQIKRGTAGQGSRVALGSDTRDPEFWRRLKDAQGADPTLPRKPTGTWSELIIAYRGSQEFGWLKPRTQKDYNSYLDKLASEAGDRIVRELTRADIYQMRDGMAKTPVAANHMISVLRTLLEWSIPRGFRTDNPAMGIKKLKSDEGGAEPWPEDAFAFVMQHAPDDLRRMAFLGRASGQRREDLVALRGANLTSDGIKLNISKLRGKAHFVPLTQAQIGEVAKWSVKDLDYFLKSPTGKPYTGDGLNSRWNRWRDSAEAKPIATAKMTIHGLRATAVCDRREAGTEDGAIADELGMSVQMVSRYARFADKARSARASRDRREARK
jgi:hypothetical protein